MGEEFIMQLSNTYFLSTYSFQAFLSPWLCTQQDPWCWWYEEKGLWPGVIPYQSHFSIRHFLYALWQVDKAPMEYNQQNGTYTCQNDGTPGSHSGYSQYHTSAPKEELWRTCSDFVIRPKAEDKYWLNWSYLYQQFNNPLEATIRWLKKCSQQTLYNPETQVMT